MLRKILPALLLACAAHMQAAILMVPESVEWVVLSPQETQTPAKVFPQQREPIITTLPEYQGIQGFKLSDEVIVELLENYDNPIPVALLINGSFVGEQAFPSTTTPIAWNFIVNRIQQENPGEELRSLTLAPDYSYEFCMTVDGRAPTERTTCSGVQQGILDADSAGLLLAAVTPGSNPSTWALRLRFEFPTLENPVRIRIPEDSIDVNVAAPVPEPSTACLLLLGAAGLLLLRKRA